MRASWCADRRMSCCTSRALAGVSSRRVRISVKPITPASGVRSSWPMCERNSVFMRSTSRSPRRSRSTNTPPANSPSGPRSAPADTATGTDAPPRWCELRDRGPAADQRLAQARAQFDAGFGAEREQPGRVLATRVNGRHTGELLGGLVEVGDAALGVDRDQRFAHAGDHGLEPVAQARLIVGCLAQRRASCPRSTRPSSRRWRRAHRPRPRSPPRPGRPTRPAGWPRPRW